MVEKLNISVALKSKPPPSDVVDELFKLGFELVPLTSFQFMLHLIF